MEQGQTEIEAISAEITLFRQKYLLSVSFCSFGYLTVDFCFLPKLHILKPPLSVSAETLSVAHYTNMLFFLSYLALITHPPVQVV